MSKSLDSFKKNLGEFNQLLAIHKSIGGSKPGRRYDLEVLNKAAVILICASWESYCEDLLFEQLGRLAQRTRSAVKVPSLLQAMLGKRLKQLADDRAAWRLAGEGWRTELLALTNELKATENFLNTPKTKQIDELFKKHLGLALLSASWRWPGMSAEKARGKLDGFVKLRGELAHGACALDSIKRKQPEDFAAFAQRLVMITDRTVLRYMKPLLPRVRRRVRRRSKDQRIR